MEPEEAQAFLLPANPQWSTETLRSLDLSQVHPGIKVPMDTEDSPWGGKSECPFVPFWTSELQ